MRKTKDKQKNIITQTNHESGEIIFEGPLGIFKLKEESEMIEEIKELLQKEAKDLTLEEIIKLKKFKKKKQKVRLNFAESGFSIVSQKKRKIDNETRGVMFWIIKNITYEGFIVGKNRWPFRKFTDLKTAIGISDHKWYKKIMPDIKKEELICKKTINGKPLLMVNPLEITKGREISELQLIAFDKLLKKELGELDYYGLVRKHGIQP